MKQLEKHEVLTSPDNGPRPDYSYEPNYCLTDDFMKSYDAGLQIDITIIDFSKGFDTVPHIKLLSEIGDYGICEPINNWLNMFLMNRKMK